MKVSLSLIALSIALTACSTTIPPAKKLTTEEMAKTMMKESSPLQKRRYTNYVNAIKNEKAGNNEKAFDLYLKAALDGYKPAYNAVGRLYYYGKGIKQDYSKAAHWLENAAEYSYDRVSLYNLGLLYHMGEGVKKDYKKAIGYYRISSKMYDEHAAKYGIRGYASAQNNLATMYENGMGVARDMKEAKRLYKMAAKQGNKNAIKSLKRIGKKEL